MPTDSGKRSIRPAWNAICSGAVVVILIRSRGLRAVQPKRVGSDADPAAGKGCVVRRIEEVRILVKNSGLNPLTEGVPGNAWKGGSPAGLVA